MIEGTVGDARPRIKKLRQQTSVTRLVHAGKRFDGLALHM